MHWHGRTLSNLEWNIHHGNALNVLKRLPSNHFSCVITSPPYFWLRDYGVPGQIGQEKTVAGYVKSLVKIMDQVYRVLTEDGLVFLNIGDTYYSGKGQSQGQDRKNSKRRFGLRAVDESGGMGIGLQRKTMIGIPWRVAIALTENKWALRSSIIWNRTNALPESVQDRPRRSYEFIFMLSKSRNYYFDRQPLIDVAEEDIWTISEKPKLTESINTAPYPDELVKRCLDIGCVPQGRVLDPFAGSGTTLRVALDSGREATGIDLNLECCEFMVSELGGTIATPIVA